MKQETKNLVESKIQDKDVMELSKDDEVREYADEFVENLCRNDMNRYNEAVNIVNKLSMGGLWRGRDIAVMFVAKRLESYSRFF